MSKSFNSGLNEWPPEFRGNHSDEGRQKVKAAPISGKTLSLPGGGGGGGQGRRVGHSEVALNSVVPT